MENELKITELQIGKLNLQPGEVLVVKIFADETSQEDLAILKGQIQTFFPENRIMLFAMPSNGKIEMDVLDTSTRRVDLSKSILAGAGTTALCAEPTAYCSNCSCGKKEAIQGAFQNE